MMMLEDSKNTADEISSRKAEIKRWAARIAPCREKWIERNGYYYAADRRYMKFVIPERARILDIGCGTGDLLSSLNPSRGLGVDISVEMIAAARSKFGHLDFRVGDIEDPTFVATLGGPFDYIVLSDTIGLLDDIETLLSSLAQLCTPDTRLVIAYYAHIWEPLLKLASRMRIRMPHPPMNFLSDTDFLNILRLANFEQVRHERRMLFPRKAAGLGSFINRYVAPLPFINRLCLRTYLVARPVQQPVENAASISVIVPCRNEKGNIAAAVKRMPDFGAPVEIIFVEGGSRDGTYEECLAVAAERENVRVLKQTGKGKGDAVRQGFAAATGDVLIILDADLTVPPETLPRFYRAIANGKGEFINATRLVYPMQNKSMPILNYFANRFFAVLFSYILGQRFSDTLCGTKVLRRAHYAKIARDRAYFGNFDPYGDFDLLLGAAKSNLKIVEIPIHYEARTYGESQISQARFSGGMILMRMAGYAFMKLRAFD